MGIMKSKDKETLNQYQQHYINTMSETVHCALCQFTLEEHPKLLYANEKAFEIVGYTREEFEKICDNEILNVIHEYDYDRVVQFVFDIMLFDPQKEFDVRVVCKDGQIKWVSCSVMRTVNADGLPVFLVSAVDITDRISYQKRIDELSENITCGLARISLVEDNTEIMSANSVFYSMFNNEEELKNKMFSCPGFLNKLYNPVFKDKSPAPLNETFEFYHNCGKEEEYCIKFTGSYVGMELEKPVYLCTFEDITTEKRLKMGQNELLTRLSGGVVSVVFDENGSCEGASGSFKKLFSVSDYRLSGGFYSFFLEEERRRIKEDLRPKLEKGETFEFTGHFQVSGIGQHMVKVCGVYNGRERGFPYYDCYVFRYDDNSFFGNNQSETEISENFKLDELTKFYNKQYIGEILDAQLSKSFSAEDGIFCVIMLQNFAEINERYGYIFGDNMLVEISAFMRTIFGENAIVGRTGGMEFSLFLKDVTKEAFSQMCEKFCNNITNIYVGEDDEIVLKCKIGITFIEEDDFYQNMYSRAHIVLHRLLHDKANKYSRDYLFDEDADIDIEKISDSEKYLMVEENTEYAKYSKTKVEEAESFKHEFISRMSHEIRTPMNAISGMADMLVAAGLTGMNLEYVNMIKSASNNLISIVDDILDISKMEDGQIEMNPEDYEIRPMVEDMSALINGRLNKKDVAFTVYVNPNLPKTLYGDGKRIKQIVMNLLSNAVKFTKKGFIRLSVDFVECENNRIEMYISVKDSGIGIDRKDHDKLFAQFSQIDSRKNRKNEGVGLGLAIAKQIAEYMGGTILVESEAGIGSKFTFIVKQKVRDKNKIADFSDTNQYNFLVYEKDKYYRDELQKLFDELNIQTLFVHNKKEFIKSAGDSRFTHVFFDYGRAFYDMKFTIEKNPSIVYAAMIGKDSTHPNILDCSNYKFVYKPLNIYDLEGVIKGKKEQEAENLQKFIAEDLKILIIDDNAVNLKVAQGLISNYQCKIVTALSGFEALDVLKEEPDFDIIFIDHMMPGMDGVATLNNIRNTFGEYGKNVPAVALTANVLPEARQLFKDKGFQGFLAKPIASRKLNEIMDELVPEEKKIVLESLDDMNLIKSISEEDIARVAMKGVDVESGLRCCGNNVDDYLHIIKVVLASGKVKVQELKKYAEEKNYEMYGIEAHAFKSVAASIGAIKQSDLAREHEFAVKDKHYDIVDKEYQKLINGYQRLLTQIQKVLDKENDRKHNEEKKIEVDSFLWKRKVKETIHAIFNFEQRQAKELLKELSGYKLPEKIALAVEQASEKMMVYEDEKAQKILEEVIEDTEISQYSAEINKKEL